VFKKTLNKKGREKVKNINMTVLIPMAGAGKRFADEGYLQPKPLIEVSGKPMIIKAVEALPEGDNYFFICRKEHVDENHIDELLEETFTNTKVIDIDYLTEGQASTCMLSYDHVPVDNQLLIGPCDNGMTWNNNKLQELVDDSSVDALIWTFRNNSTVLRNPKMYGWVLVDESNKAQKVSCKIPVSDNPVNDHAIIGSFWFRKAEDFYRYTEKMIRKDRRINNEFYVDEVMNELIEDGKSVKVFEVDKYICWGTPNDLRTYNYWEDYFKKYI
jgi:dTDP-glucose pyrophosphorylase